MKKNLRMLLTVCLCMVCLCTQAVKVTVKMNSRAYHMTLASVSTGQVMQFDSPTTEKTNGANNYVFNDIQPGAYTVTASTGQNYPDMGTLQINVTNDATQTFNMGTLQLKVGNSGWAYGTDYTVENLRVTDANGNDMAATIGTTATQNYHFCVLYLQNATIDLDLVPSATRQAEGYCTYSYSKKQTSTAPNESVTMAVETFSITAPTAAHFQLSFKPMADDHNKPASSSMGMAHYVPFTEVQPISTQQSGSNTTYTYRLETDAWYAYRTWMDGKLTLTGRFTKMADPAQMPNLTFTTADYNAFAPTWSSHDVKTYNVANIMLNINERGHLRMNVGEERDLLAQRDWQIVSTTTENFFLEPDYHFTVLNLNGQADNSVIRVTEADTHGSPWTTLQAVGKGTALVLVTYDALQYDIYNGKQKVTPTGGNKWSALWPENTGVFVVTVGDTAPMDLNPNITVNKSKNPTTEKLAGDNVDAEHDVFYYLDDEEGFEYTFTPQGAEKVEIAYPVIGSRMATYNGFSTTGVTQGDDGSYTLLLKQGRNIVRLTNAAGETVYQVMTAKPCQRTISNITHPGEEQAHPGDKIEVQYSGLFHPANKMSAVYNNSAYITYNGLEGGQSLYESANQYGFASAESAQLYGMQLPEELDVEQTPEFTVTEGCICVTGYGAAFGSHRNISKDKGLSANMNAISHKSYMGQLPSFSIPLQPADLYTVVFEGLPQGATISLTKATESSPRTQKEPNTYMVLPGIFNYTIEADGYVTLNNSVNVIEGGDKVIKLQPQLTATADAWQGNTCEPDKVTAAESADAPYKDMEGYYKITDADELAWVAAQVNGGNKAVNAVLANDINLSGNNWTPIGNNSQKYAGHFNGNDHTVSGLTISANTPYQGLFGYTDGADIRNLSVEGNIKKTNDQSSACYYGGVVGAATNSTLFALRFSGSISVGSHDIVIQSGAITNYNTNVGGIVGGILAQTTIEQCANEGSVMGGANVGGIVGNVNASTCSIKNCWNTGFISGVATTGGIVGNLGATIPVANVYNYGENIEMRPYKMWANQMTSVTVGAISGTNTASRRTGIQNAYASAFFKQDSNTTLLDASDFTEGKVAYELGKTADCWGQQFGTNMLPDFSPFKVNENENATYSFGTYYSSNTEGDYTAYTTTMTDKTEPSLPADAASIYTANFTFQREVAGGSVSTFVLPAQLPTSAINGRVYQMSAVNGTKIQFAPVAADMLQPNTPYIVETAEDGQLVNTALQNIAIEPLAQLPATTLSETSIGRVTHFGTYQRKQFTTNATNTYYGYSAGKFLKANTATLQPFRTMFVVNGSAAAKPEALDIQWMDDQATETGIRQLTTENSQPSATYDISGRKIENAANAPKQVIIVKGKKMLK